ncbi:MAG: SH3 domain-containing protein [Anaerolineales bacterium]|nr:SH3 domain-containing protein [Anaerolineales bacterium]
MSVCLTLVLTSTIDAHQMVDTNQVDARPRPQRLMQHVQSIYATQTAAAIQAAPATPAATRSASATATPPPPARQTSRTATALVNGLNVRGGPGTGYGIVGYLQAGQQVPVTGQSGGCTWLQVTLPGGRSAWITGANVYTRLNIGCGSVPAVAASRVTPTLQSWQQCGRSKRIGSGRIRSKRCGANPGLTGR